MSNNEPDDESATDSQQESEQQPADSDQPPAQSDLAPADSDRFGLREFAAEGSNFRVAIARV
jgi:hypothetical protein